MNPGEIEITVTRADRHDLFIEAIWNGRPVGRVTCDLQRRRLQLCHIEAFERVMVRAGWLRRLLTGSQVVVHNFQRHGIGSRMFDRMMAEARRLNVFEVWGFVMKDALAARPWLLDWYRARGFTVDEPDHECMDGAAHKITLLIDADGR